MKVQNGNSDVTKVQIKYWQKRVANVSPINWDFGLKSALHFNVWELNYFFQRDLLLNYLFLNKKNSTNCNLWTL